MTLARTSRAEPLRFVIVTLDHHVASALQRARERLRDELPGLVLSLHAASDFHDPRAVKACTDDIARADIVFANMLFLEEHINAVAPALAARRDHCDAMVCAMSAGDIMRQTRLGGFTMDGSSKGGPLALLKKLRGSKGGSANDGGAGQLKMLKRLPKLLRFIPGTAQDVRAYFLTLSYWLAGSSDNLADLVRALINRYADGPRKSLRGTLQVSPPREYPEEGLYHPRAPNKIVTDVRAVPLPVSVSSSSSSGATGAPVAVVGTVGLVIMRSYVLAGDTDHYDAVINALEARGLRVLPIFAAGLDARPAIERFVCAGDRVQIDALVSLTGFSLVGGPAFNDARAAEEILARLDVPYVAAQPLELQSTESWRTSPTGLSGIEATLMVAIPELDGATNPMVFAGRSGKALEPDMSAIPDRVSLLARRVARLVELRKTKPAERRLAIVLFNYPPNSGAVGTAASLSVFASLHKTLQALKDDGYSVEVPATVEALRTAICVGNSEQYGTDANVCAVVDTDTYVRAEPHLEEIEAQWGPAPGTIQSNGRGLLVLGARFGNVLVSLQPALGYEGDPMRLLFEKGFAPTHAFSASYRYLRETFGAHAALHFGTHGALEFMPGKQAGMSEACWPERLIGDVPHFYLYAANNPSEGAIAKRRSAATLVSYLTPPIVEAGLYRGLAALKADLDVLRAAPADDAAPRLVAHIQAQAVALELVPSSLSPWAVDDPALASLSTAIAELERTLIPSGLHVLGRGHDRAERTETLKALMKGSPAAALGEPGLLAILDGATAKAALDAAGVAGDDDVIASVTELIVTNRRLRDNEELPALIHALGGGFVRPGPGGDVLRTPQVLPTGRNIHGFDPFAIPSRFALHDGAEQAARVLARHVADGKALPRSVALVLWGTDTLKTGGGPIGQALALLGARPRFDSYGRLAGAELVPLAELGRPRIDVLMTVSGIFRDLLPLQTRLLAEAALLAASADEPLEQNFVRSHTLAHQQHHGCDLETAALRVFSNAEGAYGANVNQLVDGGTWEDANELADAYVRRKSFAYGRQGKPVAHDALFRSVLRNVELTYQNVDSVETGLTSLDQYVDALGGLARSIAKERGAMPEVYVSDQTQGEARVRTLSEQVAVETRTRSLNPRWASSMLEHGAEGVRHIEMQVTTTMGWSATTEQVGAWVYRDLTATYVLDDEMRRRLVELNPRSTLRMARRLIEASERRYWEPDAETLAALHRATDEIEDALEGISPAHAA